MAPCDLHAPVAAAAAGSAEAMRGLLGCAATGFDDYEGSAAEEGEAAIPVQKGNGVWIAAGRACIDFVVACSA